jgi:sortase B
VLAAILLLLAAGCYAIWDSEQVYGAADSKQYEKYKPTAENEGKSFEELRAVNPEVLAWLTVYGTNIDYPVAQGADNMKYVNTNAEGKYSLSGAIFLDSANSRDFSDFNSILYGHHMEKQAMFGEIGLFSEKKYFDARRYGNLYCDGVDHGIEFFAFLHADAYDGQVFSAGIGEESARRDYLDMLLSAATLTRELTVTEADRIVLLSTCSAASTNGRDILLGRITDETYADTFKAPTDGAKKTKPPAVDGAPGLWEASPRWAKALAISLPAALIATAALKLVLHIRKKTPRG